MDYDRILELASDNKVKLAQDFKKDIGKWLALGMTRHQCINGTLSDGHENILDVQRYRQAIKEMYYIGNEIESQKINAMEAQADLMDAEDFLKSAEKPSDKMRGEAKVLRAKARLTNCLVSIEDSTRCLNAFNSVRVELKDSVETRYPEGLEQAEPDIWKAVANYRVLRSKVGHREMVQHVPLDPETKAKLGMESNTPELAFWQALREHDERKAKGVVESFFKGELEWQKPIG